MHALLPAKRVSASVLFVTPVRFDLWSVASTVSKSRLYGASVVEISKVAIVSAGWGARTALQAAGRTSVLRECGATSDGALVKATALAQLVLATSQGALSGLHEGLALHELRRAHSVVGVGRTNLGKRDGSKNKKGRDENHVKMQAGVEYGLAEEKRN